MPSFSFWVEMRRRRRSAVLFVAFWLIGLSASAVQSPAEAHCWPDGSVPCAEARQKATATTVISHGWKDFLQEWESHNVQIAVTDGLLKVGESQGGGEHFMTRVIRFTPGQTIEVRATIGETDRDRLRLYLTGFGPASAFCDFDLTAGTAHATGAFGGAKHKKPTLRSHIDGTRELVCRVNLGSEKSVTGVRVQLLDSTGNGNYIGDPEKGLIISDVVVNTF